MKQVITISILIFAVYQVAIGIQLDDSIQRNVIEQALTMLSNI